MKTLVDILGTKRPHGGVGEQYVADTILPRLPGELMLYADEHGKPMAYFLEVGEGSRTLFVAHLDTVHREDGPNPLVYEKDLGLLSKSDGTALGADNGAGVWLLYKLAEAGISGTYLWTVGEERGGIGAKWMSDQAADFLGRFDRAVEFDRRGISSVITHHGWGGRCCSDVFAEAMATVLNTCIPMGEYRPDPTGVYTDIAEFTGVIPECTNISCGYDREHSGDETLNVVFLESLLAACLKIEWESLPVVRDPSVVDNGWGYEGAWMGKYRPSDVTTVDDLYLMTAEERVDLCYDAPETVACLLTDLMYNNTTGGTKYE